MRRLLTAGLLIICGSCALAAQDTALALVQPDPVAYPLSIETYGTPPGTGICGEALSSPLTVRVTDANGRPVPGLAVIFCLFDRPENAEGSSLNPSLVLSDSAGLAFARIILGSEPGTYHVSARIRGEATGSDLIFRIKARKKNWIYMLIIGLFGGLGLFLFGMNTMSEGMQQSAGARLRNILSLVTRNRIIGAGAGTLVTTVIQSSSATSVMLVSFVNAGLIQFRQTIPVLLGAAIGTTITAQMIAFKITEYSLLLVAAGFFIQTFAGKEQLKSVGFSIFGFGVLFYGMHIMSDAMAPLRDWDPFINLLLRLENPLLGILVGALFTALIQSSSAFIGIMIVLASQGLLSLDASIPLLLGSNLGTPVTALLSSMKSDQEAKKVALAFLLVKLISVLIFAGWTKTMGELMMQWTPDASLQRMIANAHTFINLVMMLTLLPVTPQLARLVDLLMGKDRSKQVSVFAPRYLDNAVLQTPSLALNLAKQEIIRMGTLVQAMFSQILQPFLKKETHFLDAIYQHEKEVNFLRDSIKEYLVRINAEQGSRDRVNESFQMLYTLNEFEKIADIISESLASRAERWAVLNYTFSEEGKSDLNQFHEKIEKQLERSLSVFQEMNLQQAAQMKAKHKAYRSLSLELEKQHYTRILEGMKESIDSSKTHLEILALMSTIDSHATNIARLALEWNQTAT
jgi:phosphate:Na+ symporter